MNVKPLELGKPVDAASEPKLDSTAMLKLLCVTAIFKTPNIRDQKEESRDKQGLHLCHQVLFQV